MFKNKKGVFGLTAVQSFFAIILGIALLAYIIVVVMGILGESEVLTDASYTATNESILRPKGAVVWLQAGGRTRATCGTVTTIYNGTLTGVSCGPGNYTQVGCSLINTTSDAYCNSTTWAVTYPYTASSEYQNRIDNVLGNTSTGVSGFFDSINPIYAILAVLVIVLVLVVLVRVVQAPSGRQEQL